MNARDLFEQIRSDGFRLARMEWTYETVVNYATGTKGSPADGVRVQGGAVNSIADNVAAFVDLKDAIDRLRIQHEANVRKAEKILQKCEEKEAVTVIRLHYISRLSWEEVAEFANYSVRHTIRIAKDELRKLSE